MHGFVGLLYSLHFQTHPCCSVSALHSLRPIKDLQFRHSILLRGHLLMTVCIVPIFPDNLNAVKNRLHIFMWTFISSFSWVCLGMEFVEHMTILKLLNCSIFQCIFPPTMYIFLYSPPLLPALILL